MPIERNRTRSQEEWFELVTVARKSGLTDSEWCRRNQISLNTFHNAIRRLKNNSYEIPEQKNGKILDLCSPAPETQDVVRVGLVPEPVTEDHREVSGLSDDREGLPVIDISFSHGHIRVSNEIRPELLSHLLEGLRGCL